MNVLDQLIKKEYALYNADCVDVVKTLPENSIHYTIFSPPFASLYTYSDSDRDMGNARSDDEFLEHFTYLSKYLYKVTKPGRLVSIHCMDLPAMKERDGYIGLKDFPGMIARVMQDSKFILHSKCVIWKDPLIEATRTKALGLLHKQIQKDSAMCRMGCPDYIYTFRKPGVNQEPITHTYGFRNFIGENEPELCGVEQSHSIWRRYANPVWCDINQTNTLNVKQARDERDERHICPLQLDVIGRCLELWSNPGDIVLSPYAGIGSEGYEAVQRGRKAVLIELKESYFKELKRNMSHALAAKKLNIA